jgi:hypothetical protein
MSKKRSLALPKGKKTVDPGIFVGGQETAISKSTCVEKENLRIHCHICGFDISKLGFVDRNAHVNACVDKSCVVSHKTGRSVNECNDSDFINASAIKILSMDKETVDLSNEEDIEMAYAMSLSLDDGDDHIATALSTTFDASRPKKQRTRQQNMQTILNKATAPVKSITSNSKRSSLRDVEDSLMRHRLQLNDIEERLAEEQYRKVQISKEVKKLMKKQLQLEKEERSKRQFQFQEAGKGSNHVNADGNFQYEMQSTCLADMLTRVFGDSTCRGPNTTSLHLPEITRSSSIHSLCPLWSLSRMEGEGELCSAGDVSMLLDLSATERAGACVGGARVLRDHSQDHPYFSSRVEEPKVILQAAKENATDGSCDNDLCDTPQIVPHSPSAMSQLLSALDAMDDSKSQSSDPQRNDLESSADDVQSRHIVGEVKLWSDEWCVDTMMRCVERLRSRHGGLNSRVCAGGQKGIDVLLEDVQRAVWKVCREICGDRVQSSEQSQRCAMAISPQNYRSGCIDGGNEVSERCRKHDNYECSYPEAEAEAKEEAQDIVICLDLDGLIPDTSDDDDAMPHHGRFAGGTEEISLTQQSSLKSSASGLRGRKRLHGHMDFPDMSQLRHSSNKPTDAPNDTAVLAACTTANTSTIDTSTISTGRKSSRRFSSTSSLAAALTPYSHSHCVLADQSTSASSTLHDVSTGTHVLSVWAGAASSHIFDSPGPGPPTGNDCGSRSSSSSDAECIYVMPPDNTASLDLVAPSVPVAAAPTDESQGTSASLSSHHADSFDDGMSGVVHYFGDGPVSPSPAYAPSSPVVETAAAVDMDVTEAEGVADGDGMVSSVSLKILGRRSNSSNSSNSGRQAVGRISVKCEEESVCHGHSGVGSIRAEVVRDHITQPSVAAPYEDPPQPLRACSKQASAASALSLTTNSVDGDGSSGTRRFDIIAMQLRPDFSVYSIDELKRICKSYGLKQTESRSFMSDMLIKLWERSQGRSVAAAPAAPAVRDDSVASDEMGNVGSSGGGGTENISQLTTAVLDYIRNYDVDMYEKVLSFQPLNIDEVRIKLGQHGVKISKVMLRDIFDNEGIFVCCI